MIESVSIEPKYKRENGIWVIDIDTIATPTGFTVFERSIVSLPPHQAGGNHKHPRVEAIMCMSQQLKLYWQDASSTQQQLLMEELMLYIVPAGLPHAVFNESSSAGYLLELADGPQRDVVMVEVTKIN